MRLSVLLILAGKIMKHTDVSAHLIAEMFDHILGNRA